MEIPLEENPEQGQLIKIINLESGFFCDEEILGKSFKINIHGINGFLEFPSLVYPNSNTDERPILSMPKIFNKYIGKEDSIYKEYLEKKFHPWGHVRMYEPRKYIEVIVTDVCLCLVSKDIEDYKKIIIKTPQIEKWVNLFTTSLQIFMRDIFVTQESEPIYMYTNFRSGNYYLIPKTRKGEIQKFLNEQLPHTIQGPFLGKLKGVLMQIDKSTIETIIKKSNEFKESPLPFQLLLEARKFFHQKNYRSTVLECATAVEVVLTEKIKKHIYRNYNKNLSQSIIEKYSKLSERYRLLKNLGLIDIEVDINHLNTLRNNTIHQGEKINKDDAEKAYDISEEIIYYLTLKIKKSTPGSKS